MVARQRKEDVMMWQNARWSLLALGAVAIWAIPQAAVSQHRGPADAPVNATEGFKEEIETPKPSPKSATRTASETERPGVVEPSQETPAEAKNAPRRDPKVVPFETMGR
jgi:hypothetical protein